MSEAPTFFCIGAARSGTTWAWECLRHHPEVIVTQPKETDYFSHNFHRGESWYLAHFPNLKRPIRGEVNPNYLHHPEVAERIFQLYPQSRIIAILRDPRERAISHILFRARGDGASTKLESLKTYANDELLERSRYYTALKPYFDRFGSDQVRVVFYDELRDSPVDFQSQLYKAVGADPNFRYAGASKVVNKAKPFKYPRLLKIIRAISAFIKRHRILRTLWETFHRTFTIRRFLLERLKVAEVAEPQFRFEDFYSKDQEALLLEELGLLREEWGLEVPKTWLPE